jgi:hypothetical protein
MHCPVYIVRNLDVGLLARCDELFSHYANFHGNIYLLYSSDNNMIPLVPSLLRSRNDKLKRRIIQPPQNVPWGYKEQYLLEEP